jgi:hypothetical protein
MLASMAKPKKKTVKKPVGAPVETPKKPVNRTGVGVTIYMDPVLKRELSRYVEATRRTITGEIEEAIRKHLQNEGYWPPKAETN